MAGGRFRGLITALAVVCSVLAVAPAGAQPTDPAPPPDLRGTLPSLDVPPTGTLLERIRTQVLRDATPVARDVLATASPIRILMIGTGVRADVFPPQLQPSIVGSADDLADPLGHGTLAASVLMQMLPNADITSFRVPLLPDGTLSVRAIVDGLTLGLARRDAFDAVLLAFPPHLAMDPFAAATLETTAYGTGLDALWQAILDHPATTEPLRTGIPLDDVLRQEVFARAPRSLRQPLERFVARAKLWQDVDEVLRGLDAAGVAVIAPSGDLPTHPRNDHGTRVAAHAETIGPDGARRAASVDRTVEANPVESTSLYGDRVACGRDQRAVVHGSTRVYTDLRHECVDQVNAPTQSVYGLAARRDVITVGASFMRDTDGLDVRTLSPASAIGPTLSLGLKPDFLAPSDVVGLVPSGAVIGAWNDAADHSTNPQLQWAAQGVGPSPCDEIAAAGRCVLQGSSMVAAAVAAANIAALVARSTPHTAELREGFDDELLLRYAQARAGSDAVVPSDLEGVDPRTAHPWEQGSGVLNGLGGFDDADVAIPPPDADGDLNLGEVTCEAGEKLVPLGDAVGSVGQFELDRLLVARERGDAQPFTLNPADAGERAFDTVVEPDPADPGAQRVRITKVPFEVQGGLYAGYLELRSATGRAARFPVAVIQDLCPDFRALYARDRHSSPSDGQPVEDVTIGLLPSIPGEAGIFGRAFKYLQEYAADPTATGIRFGVTRGGDDESRRTGGNRGEPGTTTISAVPPGFWRYQLVSDYTVDGLMRGSEVDALGVKMGGHSPEAANIPGSTVFVESLPACPAVSRGPLGQGCRDVNEWRASGGGYDNQTGFCTVAGPTGTWNLYCGEARITVPAAVVSRAVHLAEFDDATTEREFRDCVLDVPRDGTRWNLDAIAEEAARCPTATRRTLVAGGDSVEVPPSAGGTSWTVRPKAPECLPANSSDPADAPAGRDEDLTATFAIPSGRSATLPIGVLTYRFALPNPNVFTTVAVNFSYKVRNALVAVRVGGRGDFVGDTAGGVMVTDGSNVTASGPGVTTQPGRGSIHSEFVMLTSGSTSGAITFMFLPLATSLEVPSVQMCGISLKVITFAKQQWADPTGARSSVAIRQAFDQAPCISDLAGNACRLSEQIGPMRQTPVEKCRSRGGRNPLLGHDIAEVGRECEDALVAVHVPKRLSDTKASEESGLSAISGANGEDFLSAPDGGELRSYDGGLRWTRFALLVPCQDNERGVCERFNAALERGQVVLGLPPAMYINGRFFDAFPVGAKFLRRAKPFLMWELSFAKDARSPLSGAFPVQEFHGIVHGLREAQPADSSVLSIARDANTDVMSLELALPNGQSTTLRAAVP